MLETLIMGLAPELTYRVTTADPLPTTKGAPYGERMYWTVRDAELTGARLNARLAAPGMDWMAVGHDGFWRPDVRAAFLTTDGATIWMHYTGLVEQTDAFRSAAEANRETGWSDQYMRLVINFETGADQYRWLAQSFFVAAGRLLGTGRIEYAVHRLT
jgi:Protein of unknown function (DUF3237)